MDSERSPHRRRDRDGMDRDRHRRSRRRSRSRSRSRMGQSVQGGKYQGGHITGGLSAHDKLCRELFVGNTPPGTSEALLMQFLNGAMRRVGLC